MEEKRRIRVVFKDDDILSDAQKSEGLSRSWLLLKPYQHHDTVSDVASHLLRAFQLHRSCPHGLILSVSGFVLPPFESTGILGENEVIRVTKRRDVLAVEGSCGVAKLEGVVKQPVTSGVLLLANEEFDKEIGGFESDDPEEESDDQSEEALLQNVENPPSGNVDRKNRKRKAPEKLRGSKKKKQRPEALEGGIRNKIENAKDKGESAELHASDAPMPDMNGPTEAQENSKDTEDAKVAPKETKKVPSRSARRKYAKRRWLREMAKIQKTNAACESESLRNWKEDQAKAEKNKFSPLKFPQKWKKPRVDAEITEVDGQPKGLLHWKQSSQNSPHIKGKKHQQRNQIFHKRSNQNYGVAKQQNQNGDGHEPSNQKDIRVQPDDRNGADQQAYQRNGDAQQPTNYNRDASMRSNEAGDDDEIEVVPVVIRPGHIRFEPLEKEQAVQQNYAPSDTVGLNEITSKDKGQIWGKENSSFSAHNEYKTSDKENSEGLSTQKEEQRDRGIDFDKLPPLPSTPHEGDLIAYRILQLTSSWIPELTAYRVGKVSWYNAISNKAKLLPVPDYPIVLNTGVDEDARPDTSLYKEDGSLEIDFSLLIDVRIFNKKISEPTNEPSSEVINEDSLSKENAPKTVLPSNNEEQMLVSSPAVVETAESNQEKETQPPTAVNGGSDIWEQITEALNAKEEQLTKESSWGKTPPKVQIPQQDNSGWRPWDKKGKNVQPSSVSRWGKNAKVVGPPSQVNSWGKNAKVVHPPSQVNSWGKNTKVVHPPSLENSLEKESSGNKGVRGDALGSTMDILKSLYRGGY